MKRKKFVSFFVVLLLMFIGKVCAEHYVLDINSVDSWEIRLWSSSKYSTELSNAITTWNNYWSINIAPDTLFTIQDLTIYDVYNSDVTRSWRWCPTSWADEIELNEWFFDGDSYMWSYTSNEKQHTVWHELWHALWLEHHSLPNNVMRSSKWSYITLWVQDKYDYDYLWE
jgi:hypothetical protein